MLMINKFMDKYKSIPIPARASFWFLICGILQNGLSIITLPIFTRMLTTDQYGLSSTYFAWNDLLVVFCTLRLSYGVFDKGMIKYSESRDRFESALLGLTTTISVIMMAIFLAFHGLIEKLFGMSFILCFSLFATQVFAPALLFWTSRNRYEYKYRKFTIVTISTAVLCTFLNLLAVLLLDYDRGVVKILSYQIIWVLVYVVFYINIFARGKVFFDREIWKYALGFNLPLIPYFLSTLILDKADRIMIGHYCGNSYVALYSVSYNLGRLMVLLTSALDATFTPWIYQKIKENDYGKSKQVSTFIMIGMMVLGSLFMLFAPELIAIFADARYKEAVYVIPPVVASYFFVMLYQLVSKVEFYFEKTKTIAVITVGAALMNVVLNALAIPRFGYIAAGYTTLISYIFMSVVHLIVSHNIAKKKKIADKLFPWGRFLAIGVLMIFITVMVNVLYRWAVLRLILIGVILAGCIIARKKIVEIFKLLR